MLKISGTTISLTRGDSAKIELFLTYKNGDTYEPREGDSIRFAVKKSFNDLVPPLLIINIPTDTLLLHITPEQSKQLAYGSYKYDIQMTTADGDVDTFIDKATFIVTEEVD